MFDVQDRAAIIVKRELMKVVDSRQVSESMGSDFGATRIKLDGLNEPKKRKVESALDAHQSLSSWSSHLTILQMRHKDTQRCPKRAQRKSKLGKVSVNPKPQSPVVKRASYIAPRLNFRSYPCDVMRLSMLRHFANCGRPAA